MTTSEAAGGSATTDVMTMLRAAGKKAFFPSTNPETGWWQDSAGTTQAALEQPVGRITDLSGGSFHATQATSVNRPTYTKRVNLLAGTAFTGAVAGSPGTVPTYWTDLVSTGQIVSLSGGVLTVSATAQRRIISQVFTFLANAQYFLRFVIGSNSGVVLSSIAQWNHLLTGTSETWQANGATVTYGSYVPIAGDVITSTFTVGATGGTMTVRLGIGCPGNATGTVGFSTPDLRLSAFAGMNLPVYQRVGNGAAGTADYDTVGFRPMLYFDGTNDALATPAIDLSGTDQIMALANVLKVSDAAQGMVYETTASSAANNGSMFISAPAAASATFSAGSRGTALATATSAASYAAPNLACLRFDADVSSDSVALLRQAASIATSATDQGTGNYSSAALYIGARAGTSLFFKGYMFPGPLLDTTGIPTALLDQMAREQAALWGVAI